MKPIRAWKVWAGLGSVVSLATIFNRSAHHACINGYTLRLAGVVSLLAFGLPLAGSAAPRQKLSGGHVPAAVARLQPIKRLPATNQLRLAIGLPLRDPAGLDQFLAEVYDPASPNYRHFLTPEEFTARFSATEADYAVLKHFALTNGFKITAEHGNRLLLDVVGRTADVERAFRIKLQTYQHPTEGREFFAPDTEPTVEAGLAVADIQGLSDYSRPHANSHRMALSTGVPNNGSAPDGSSYLGDDFRNAYIPGATSLTGAGQVVGLFQADGYYAGDIAAYAAAARNGRANIVIQAVPLDGFDGKPITGPNNGNDEVSLDIEMAMAMAPGLSRIVVFEGNPTNFIPNDILGAMAASNTIKNLSCSWTWIGGPTNTTDNIFKTMASLGQSFFQASGDYDAFVAGSNNDVDKPSQKRTPSSCPYITVVGGTVLTMNGTGASYASETVWNERIVNPHGGNWGSSGGISTNYPIPSYQQGIGMSANQGSTTWRNIPDVALTAHNVYVISGGSAVGSGGWFGTSCAAPLWAGFTALINQQAGAFGLPPVGFLNPALYTIGRSANYLAAFNDITTGDNYWLGSPTNYPAVVGYDLCTGLGTPNGTNLINILTVGPVGPPSHPLPPSPPAIVSQPQSLTVNPGASATFTVIATGTPRFSYQWLFNGQPISTATGYSYSIARVQSSQAGAYTVVVSNAYGSVTSDPATLVIAPAQAPTITTQPQSQAVTAGADVTFSVIAVGTAPLNYQWFFNSQPIRTATGSSYSIAGVQSSQAGTYTVVVSNPYGSVLSAPATLVISSGSGVLGIIGAPFSYQITANNDPTWYSASRLPPGLGYNGITGLISGTPTRTGTFSVHVEARNTYGSVQAATILFTIADGAITSATSAQGVIGVPFSYQIVADNSPTWRSASGLPSGLTYDGTAGLIYGTPTQPGTFPVQVQARNIFGSASATISLTISNGAIISATSAQGVIGVPFSYQIVADNSPTWYSASGLPSGLHNDSGSGLISGTPNRAGTFPVQVQARNFFGSASATILFTVANSAGTSATSSVPIYVVSDRLTLLTVGSGRVSPNYSNAVLEVGKSYKLTATAGSGNVFSNWVGSILGSTVFSSDAASLSFTMRSNLVLQANFIPSPFIPAKGTYYGLFSETNRAQESSGMLSLNLTANGAYSGSLERGRDKYAFTGKFDVGGQASAVVSRRGTNAWVVRMGLDIAAQQLRGWVSNGIRGGWVAGLLADRAVFDSRTNPATQYLGKYTLRIPGGTNEDGTTWLGDGYLTLSVDAGGKLSYGGSLADGTNVTPGSAIVSRDGDVPFYLPLYNGKGSVWSWLQFDTNQPATGLGGWLSWIKPPGMGAYYPAGLTNEVTTEGARYTPPTNSLTRVIQMTNAVLIFDGGNLNVPLINAVMLTASNKVIDLSLTNKLSLSLTVSNGIFSGSVREPGLTRSNSFKGVLLQDENSGRGYFLGTNRSGSVILRGAE